MESYPSPLLDKIIYEFGEIIYLKIHDNYGLGSSFIKIDVYINEYIINCSHKKFWQCLDCKGNNNNDYIYNEDKQYFDFYKPKTVEPALNYTLSFKINSPNELDFEGNNVSSDFYILNPYNEAINISFYDIDNEIELVNFNNSKNFYIKNNAQNLKINYKNYYFKIYFDNNNLTGKYIGLDLNNNSNIELYNGAYFKINKSKGLRYILIIKRRKNEKRSIFSFSNRRI